MKLRLLLIFAFMSALSAYADTDRIVIKQKSGNETILELATNPIITFSDENMIVASNITTITIPLADVDNYVVYDSSTDIKQLTENHQFVNGHVAFRNLPNGTVVTIHSIDGRLVARQYADGMGIADISLDQLPLGTYIISAGNNRIKVINK